MKTLSILTALLLSSLGLLATARATARATDSHAQRATDPNPVAWLEGHWIGTGFGGEAEEVWLAPQGGTMSCIFRLSQKQKPSFYELFTVGPAADGWEMRLKHFHADLRGWEERDESLVWPYEPLGERGARFGPVTYELSEKDVLTVTVEVDDGNGSEANELVFLRKE